MRGPLFQLEPEADSVLAVKFVMPWLGRTLGGRLTSQVRARATAEGGTHQFLVDIIPHPTTQIVHVSTHGSSMISSGG